MQFIRRILYIPLMIVLVGTLLIAFNVIQIDVELPIGIEWIAMFIAGTLVTMFLLDMQVATRSWQHPEPEDPPKSDKVVYPKPLEDTINAMQEAEDYMENVNGKVNGRVKIAIDIEEDPEEE